VVGASSFEESYVGTVDNVGTTTVMGQFKMCPWVRQCSSVAAEGRPSLRAKLAGGELFHLTGDSLEEGVGGNSGLSSVSATWRKALQAVAHLAKTQD
jgi:hypothetical protein